MADITTGLARAAWGAVSQNRRILRAEQRRFLEKVGPVRVLEIGSGGRRRGRDYQSARDLAVPGSDFLQTDVDPARGHRRLDVLEPDPDVGRFDAVLCCNVLEHVLDLDRALEGIRRLVTADGRVLASTPFVYPLHDEPADYWRPTEHALRRLFERHWHEVRVRPVGMRRFPFQIIVESSHLRTVDVTHGAAGTDA